MLALDDSQAVEAVFRAILNIEPSVALESIDRDTHSSWDSMTHVAIISALDDEFDLVIESADAVKICSYASCLSILEHYLV